MPRLKYIECLVLYVNGSNSKRYQNLEQWTSKNWNYEYWGCKFCFIKNFNPTWISTLNRLRVARLLRLDNMGNRYKNVLTWCFMMIELFCVMSTQHWWRLQSKHWFWKLAKYKSVTSYNLCLTTNCCILPETCRRVWTEKLNTMISNCCQTRKGGFGSIF